MDDQRDPSPSTARPALSPDDLERRRAVWSRHWSSGAMHSCDGSFGAFYDGSIGEFWRAAFGKVRTGDRILDLATGNGPLPRMLLASAADRAWSCDAVDLAQVKPAWLADLEAGQRSRIRFHGGVAAEALPFPDKHFDLIVSQFGIEYADLERAIPELSRVGGSHGRVALIMHHADARPVSLAALELGHIEWLLGNEGLVSATRHMLEPLARSRTPEGRTSLADDVQANASRDAFNRAQAALTDRATRQPDGADILHEARDGLAACVELALCVGHEAAQAHLAMILAHLDDTRWRLGELRSHALDDRQLTRIQAQLARQWTTVTCNVLHDHGFPMAWSVLASGPKCSDTDLPCPSSQH